MALALGWALGGCGRPAETSGPFGQRGYLWQREWNGAVADGFREATARLNGVIVLGGEVVWENAAPRLIKASVAWDVLAASGQPVALGLRIAPFGGPFASDDATARALVDIARGLLGTARAHGVVVGEVQVDFDSSQRHLPGYRAWLRALRAATRPTRFVITTLPSWLKEAAFADLLAEVDGFVLQVHSVPTARETGRAWLCDPALARRWVEQAARLGRPFSVALPTYRCVAGYDPAGKLLGVAMDAGLPPWPSGTRTLDFASDAPALAALVHAWQARRPAAMHEVIWYRVPVATDVRNWRWPTLAAVMAGRTPAARFEVRTEGDAPVDVWLSNAGETDDAVACEVTLRWEGAQLTASDALAGWSLKTKAGEAVFTTSEDATFRLAPGARRALGWLRLDPPVPLQSTVSFHATPQVFPNK